MNSQFSKLRSFLWPIHRHELKLFLPMLLIFFLICFNYNLLRAAKDTLIVTAPFSGAEAIPFIKVWAMLPTAIFMTFLFSRFSTRFGREKTFYLMMGIFLSFFFLFAFVLYPLRETLHPHGFADELQKLLPMGCKGLITLFRNWTFTAFYVMSEMWSSMIMTVLFWGFANEITSVPNAKRFYALLGIGANFAGIFSGQMTILLASKLIFLPVGDAWQQTLILINSVVIIAGMLAIGIFRHLNKRILPSMGEIPKPEEEVRKPKSGFFQSFAILGKSKYLLCIAIIVIGYNLSINLIEVIWKDQVKQLYSNPNDFQCYMGKVYTHMGILSTAIALLLSGPLIRRFHWSFGAMITPFIMLVTGIGFFSFLLFQETSFWGLTALIGSTPLAVCVFFGSLQNCLARASKYTLFDATKELSFIPLDTEVKLRGKAAIDGVGSRLGKSGGSLIHQCLLMIFGSVALSTPYVATIFLIAIVLWMMAVSSLGKKFTQLISLQKVEPEKPSQPSVEVKEA